INGTIRYYDWDQATIVRAAAFRAEGAAFPESTASWVRRSVPIEKIGDTIPVTEEFMEDEEMFAAELAFFLETNVKLAKELSVYSGNG
ncbi:phage major capsid protein, partial [Oenococcus oeni]|uniref:phage major capsid family protein n=1 Tax=Oenococcus oeni TaxID=1247 RepID=UPI001C5B039F